MQKFSVLRWFSSMSYVPPDWAAIRITIIMHLCLVSFQAVQKELEQLLLPLYSFSSLSTVRYQLLYDFHWGITPSIVPNPLSVNKRLNIWSVSWTWSINNVFHIRMFSKPAGINGSTGYSSFIHNRWSAMLIGILCSLHALVIRWKNR